MSTQASIFLVLADSRRAPNSNRPAWSHPDERSTRRLANTSTGIAMLTAQLQTLQTHLDFTLSISIGIGSYCRTAKLHNGTWQGHDLTHHFDDHRSSLPYNEPNWPPMEQQQVRPNSSQISVATPITAPESAIDNLPTQPTATQQFDCILPTTPSPMLSSPPPSSSISVRRLEDTNIGLMLPSSFRGKG